MGRSSNMETRLGQDLTRVIDLGGEVCEKETTGVT